MLSEETTLLKIYSLFVLADGKWTPSIKENLDEIAKSLKVNENEANEIYGDSRASVWSSLPDVNLSDDYSFEVISEIEDVLNMGPFWLRDTSNSKSYKSERANVLWNMVLLGYDDGKYSGPEKKVIEHLAIKWKIKPIILTEFMDTAETLKMLERQKDWIKTTQQEYDEISKQLEIVDQNIKTMLDNARITIFGVNDII